MENMKVTQDMVDSFLHTKNLDFNVQMVPTFAQVGEEFLHGQGELERAGLVQAEHLGRVLGGGHGGGQKSHVRRQLKGQMLRALCWHVVLAGFGWGGRARGCPRII